MAKTEFYVRFHSEKYGAGIFESPCQDIQEAAGQFTEDEDAVSAMKITLDDKGRLISAEDVTEEVLETIRDLIEADAYTRCPHPMLEDYYTAWEEACERGAQEQREHERIESAMIHM